MNKINILESSNKQIKILFYFCFEYLTIMASQTEENYLKALFALSKGKDSVNISELSSLLKVSLPTVNNMVKTLNKKALVNYEKYKPISLTERGKKLAASIIRKHRLTEMFLLTKMGFKWDEVHEIAEQIEHINSPIFFERMDELLEFPTIDPHGSPIPDKEGNIIQKENKRLSDCKTGAFVRLVELSNDSSDFLKFLNSKELYLGVDIEIKSIEAYDQSKLVGYINHPSETLSKIVCECLLVEVVKRK